MSGTRDPAPGGLVGRRRELTAIAAAVRRLDRRNAQFVAISGEPGIGKTSLLEELARRAEASGARVLAGRGTELEGDLPFGVWVDAFDAHVAWLGHERLERLIGAAAAAQLAGVLPAAAPAAGTPPLADERFQAHRAVRVLLERIAAAGPLVVLLDDVHWADGASLELLVHLLRRPPRATLLLGLGFRSGRLPPEVAAALQATDRAGTLVDLPLAPLTEDDAGALLGAGAPAGLYGLAGGNPFYLMELARAGAATAADAAETGVPAAVAAAMTHEIAELSEPARLLAEGAAVAGDGAELELAAAAAGIGRETALAALDEIVAASLLRATGEGRRYRFRHPIVRRAVYEAAGEGWRLAAHARAAAELERRGAGLGARAQHVERCAELGDEAAIALLAAAGLEAAPRAPGATARWLGAALRLMPQREEDASRRLQLLVPLAGALASTGQLERALATLLAALELIPAELVELRVRLVCACAGCENLLGRHMAAHERLLRVLGEVAEDSGEAACALCAELAADALFDADFGQMNLWAERASAAADALGDPALRVTAAALLCFARYAQGAIADAEAARATAASLLDGLPDAALAGRLEAAYYLGFAEFFCEHYDEAIGHLRRGIAVSRAAGLGQFVVPMMVGLAHALEVRGRLPEALDTAEGAVEAARLARNRQMASWALVAEGWIAAMTGDSARADAAAEEAVALVSGLDLSVVTLATHAHAAVIFLEAGRPERCLQQAVSAGAPEFPSIEPSRRAWLQAALARAELARGHPEGAARWIERAERSLGDGPLPLAEAAVLTARAQSASAGGDHAAAARFASRAAERADAVGADVDAARARVLAGQALARAGDRDGAGRLLARAEADLTACGAHRLRDEAARELRRLGRHVSARQRRFAPGKGAGALSGREREIADLVAAGNTNRQIAAQLFLSEKTIESHLSNVFAKLGVGSRAAVAAAVARQGDDADG